MATKDDLKLRIKQEIEARQAQGEMMNLDEYSDALATAIFEVISGEIVDAEDRHYVFSKEIAATTWTITHGLNKKPHIIILDTDGNVVEGIVQYIGADGLESNNELKVIFSVNVAGTAYLN